MFALVDCNNFYASCERLFRPDLRGKPVAVLSNNDGCIIARSNEVKALGIPMGAPTFKFAPLIKQHNVHLFSSNYELYADMSYRVVEVLRTLAPEVEVYSIDECFLSLRGMQHYDLLEFGHLIKQRVTNWTGIPVGVGIAPTKSLAKVANKQAKLSEGVCVLDDGRYCQQALQQFPVEDLWGVGRQYAKKLNAYGIVTAADLTAMPDKWIKQEMTVQGLRLVLELRGISCIPLEEMPEPQKALAVTRSFGKRLTEIHDVREALAHYVTRAGEKLRAKGLQARHMQVFLHTSRFSNEPYYGNARSITLPWHTNYTPELMQHASTLLISIYRKGFRYSKCGVVLTDLLPASEIQNDLFSAGRNTEKQQKLMQAVDALNTRMGKHTVAYAGAGIRKSWSMTRNQLSPCYTTRWEELASI